MDKKLEDQFKVKLGERSTLPGSAMEQILPLTETDRGLAERCEEDFIIRSRHNTAVEEIIGWAAQFYNGQGLLALLSELVPVGESEMLSMEVEREGKVVKIVKIMNLRQAGFHWILVKVYPQIHN